MTDSTGSYAVPSYSFEWPTITDPDGVERNYIKYPGTCVPHDVHGDTTPTSEVADMGWTKAAAITYHDDLAPVKIPVNMHVGCMGLAPASHDVVDSIPPMPSGGNLDDKRIGVGMTMYYPVEVAGALLSMGDAHMAQGDSELDGPRRGVRFSTSRRLRGVDASAACALDAVSDSRTREMASTRTPSTRRCPSHAIDATAKRRHGHRDLDHGQVQARGRQGCGFWRHGGGPRLPARRDGDALDRPLVRPEIDYLETYAAPRRHLRRVQHRRRHEELLHADPQVPHGQVRRRTPTSTARPASTSVSTCYTQTRKFMASS